MLAITPNIIRPVKIEPKKAITAAAKFKNITNVLFITDTINVSNANKVNKTSRIGKEIIFKGVLKNKLCKCIFQDKNVKTKKAVKKDATLRSDPTQAAEYYDEEQRYNTAVFLRRVFPSG